METFSKSKDEDIERVEKIQNVEKAGKSLPVKYVAKLKGTTLDELRTKTQVDFKLMYEIPLADWLKT